MKGKITCTFCHSHVSLKFACTPRDQKPLFSKGTSTIEQTNILITKQEDGLIKHLWYFLFLLCLVLSACVHYEPPHSGIVKDAETKQPIRSVKVTFGLHFSCLLPPYGPLSYPFDDRVTYTDKDGRYFLFPKLNLMYPLICSSWNGSTIFHKMGYFSDGFEQRWIQEEVYLYKKHHYLDYYEYPSPENNNSKGNNEWVESRSVLNLVQADGLGVFLRVPGRECTMMYTRKRNSDYAKLYYVFDEKHHEWLVFNQHGLITDCDPNSFHSTSAKTIDMKTDIQKQRFPDWQFIGFDTKDINITYADRNSFIYCIDSVSGQFSSCPEKEKPPYMPKGRFRIDAAYKGNITALVGLDDGFATIEDDGKLLCIYHYDQADFVRTVNLSHKYNTSDFPLPNAEDSMGKARFKILKKSDKSSTRDHYMVVIRAKHTWQIYDMIPPYYKEKEVINMVMSLPGDKEITDIVDTQNGLYIAFKGEGIRRYLKRRDYVGGGVFKELDYQEDPSFFEKSQAIPLTNAISLVSDRELIRCTLFITTGDNKIYRLSIDGTPDFRVKEQ